MQYKAYKDTTIETQQDSAKCWTGRAQGTAQATMSRKGLKNEKINLNEFITTLIAAFWGTMDLRSLRAG